MASGFDLSSVLNALGAGQGQTQANMGGMQAAGEMQKQAIMQEGEAIGAAGEAQKTVKAQQDAGLLIAQEQSRRAATSLGTNMSDATQIVTQIGNDMRNSYAQMQADAAKVNKIEANATLSNPLGLLYDVLAGDQARANLKGSQTKFDIASKTLQSLNQATQQTAATNLAIAETKSEASNKAGLDFIDAQTKQAQAQNQQKLAGVDIQMFQALDSMNARQISYAVQGYGLVAQEEQRQWSRMMRETEMEMRKENKQVAQATLDMYNAGLQAAGQNRTVDAASMKLEMATNKQKFDYILSMGVAATTGYGSPRYGADPAQALTGIQAFRINLPAAQAQLAKSLSTDMSQALTPTNLVAAGMAKDVFSAQQLLADKKNHPAIQSQYLLKKAERDINSINPNDTTNLYAPPPIDVLKGKSELQNNPLLKDYLLPSVEAGGNIRWDPSAMIKAGADGMMTGKYSSTQVADAVSWTASQLMLSSDTTRNYRGFGLPTLSEFGKMYMPLNIDPGGYFNTINASIDVNDPVQVTSLMQRIIAATPGRTFADRLDKLLSTPEWLTNALNRNTQQPDPGMRIVPGGPNQMVR